MKNAPPEQGFTLAEILITLVTSTLVLTWASRSVLTTSAVTQHLRESTQLANEVDNLQFWFRRDLVETDLVSSRARADDLILVSGQAVETRYRVVQETLERNGDAVADNVTSFLVRYLDPAGTSVAPESCRCIEITITVTQGNSVREFQHVTSLRQLTGDLESVRYDD